MSRNRVRSVRRGFTLVEIMIVVLIIGILQSIAIPNFIRARESARARSCTSNLQRMNGAVEQWALDARKNNGATVAVASLVGGARYIRNMPECPSGGSYGADLTVGLNPTCTIDVNGDTDAYNDHTLP